MSIGLFFPAVTGMNAQSHALSQVSNNIIHSTTTGYKTTDTMFYTLLGSNPVVKNSDGNSSSSKYSSRADVHGVGIYDRVNISAQGIIQNTSNNYDAAISGNGNAFFILDDDVGNRYYSRDGQFDVSNISNNPLLVNHSGLYVQGYKALEDGTFESTLSNIGISPAGDVKSVATTQIKITANVPATGVDSSSYNLLVYGPENDGETVTMLFSKIEDMENAWDVTFVSDKAAVSGGGRVIFSPNGEIVGPKTFDINVAWKDGSGNNSVNVDISKMTQFSGSSAITSLVQNGAPSGTLQSTKIEDSGVISSTYSNGKVIPLARLGLASFRSPNSLTAVDGTLFEYNIAAGEISYWDSDKTDEFIVAGALERSTVDLATEFSDLILVQRAYSSNANSFTVINEMLQTLVDI